ncbi:glycosyl hydrolase [Myxococcota bacterium]
MRAIIPGGSHHPLFRVYLDRVADFLQSCRGDQGELIPMIFRPFHEHNAGWFWWGRPHASDQEFQALWRFTVDYLRVQRGLSQLLWAFFSQRGRDHRRRRVSVALPRR